MRPAAFLPQLVPSYRKPRRKKGSQIGSKHNFTAARLVGFGEKKGREGGGGREKVGGGEGGREERQEEKRDISAVRRVVTDS